jgi:flagellar biosynthesis regulator FlbT
LFCLAYCWHIEAVGQRPRGRFLADTIQVGKPFEYALSFRHYFQKEVFFPDTSTQFSPFQVVGQRFFRTQTTNQVSLDSAVYTLLSFETAARQTLRVPVWTIDRGDCTAVMSNVDTVFLNSTLFGLKKPVLQTDTEIVPLRSQINFPLILLVTISVLLFAAGIYLLFGDALSRQWQLFLMFRRNRDFRRGLLRLSRDTAGTKGIENIEKALILWKTYLQRLEQKPFLTYTTKEIIDNLPDEDLADALRQIDSVVYGGQASVDLKASLEILRNTADQTYQKQRQAFVKKIMTTQNT